jgi:tellurite resistance protein TehA-like permease
LLELTFVVQLALGVVFCTSAAAKLLDSGGFRKGLAAYEILPASMVTLASLSVIGLECSLAITHVTGFSLEVATRIGLGLLTIFFVVVAINLRRGRELPCHCFGEKGDAISGATLARLALLGAGELYLLRVHRPVHPWDVALPEFGYALFWAVLALTASTWVFQSMEVLDVIRSMR